MHWPKIGETQYYALLRLSDKGRLIKDLTSSGTFGRVIMQITGKIWPGVNKKAVDFIQVKSHKKKRTLLEGVDQYCPTQIYST